MTFDKLTLKAQEAVAKAQEVASEQGQQQIEVEHLLQALLLIFNNAGVGLAGQTEKMPVEDWNHLLDINLRGVVSGVTAAYPIMVEQGFGHIVNTASIAGLMPFLGIVAYAASKHAVVGLSMSLRLESLDHGVQVSAVCPGYIKTRIIEDSKLIGVNREKLMDKLPGWIGISPDKCARRILKGVRRRKAIFTVTVFARVVWWLMRLSPNLVIWLQRQGLKKWRRDGVLIEDED